MEKIKYLLIICFLIISKILFTQNNSVIELKEIYVLGPGDDVDTWCKQENVFLEFDDSILIKFNESSTFEKRIFFKNPIKLDKNYYRIILKNNSNEILHIQTFSKDSVINGGIVLNLDYKRCCRNGFERYVFFDKNSSQIVETFCDTKKVIIDLITKSNVKIELIGLIGDSTNEILAHSRLNNVQLLLLDCGVKKENIIQSITKENQEKSGYSGSEYLLVYPDKMQKEELGVILKVKDI